MQIQSEILNISAFKVECSFMENTTFVGIVDNKCVFQWGRIQLM